MKQSEAQAYRECDSRMNKFYRHVEGCGVCQAAQPDPEAADLEKLCRNGQTLRLSWERLEEDYARRFSEVSI